MSCEKNSIIIIDVNECNRYISHSLMNTIQYTQGGQTAAREPHANTF